MAARLGISEDELIARLRALLEDGVIKRLGLIVRHHELGYAANAMVVWDVPDGQSARLAGACRNCRSSRSATGANADRPHGPTIYSA